MACQKVHIQGRIKVIVNVQSLIHSYISSFLYLFFVLHFFFGNVLSYTVHHNLYLEIALTIA